jgi:Holliday junction DNA helicase RuvA
MIGRLTGIVVESARESVVVDVRGVGYEVFLPARDLAALPPGTAVTLVIETIVREDSIRLYGFREAAARDWFRLLQGVQGVGAKVALAVLSVLAPAELARAVAVGDRAAIARANGVGRRVAERIATELKDKGPPLGVVHLTPAVPAAPEDEALADAISALVNLGYDEGRAREAVTRLRAAAPAAGAADLIRGGLKALAA